MNWNFFRQSVLQYTVVFTYTLSTAAVFAQPPLQEPSTPPAINEVITLPPLPYGGQSLPLSVGEAINSGRWRAETLSHLPLTEIRPDVFAISSVVENRIAADSNPYALFGLHLIEVAAFRHPEAKPEELAQFANNVVSLMQKKSPEAFQQEGKEAVDNLLKLIEVGAETAATEKIKAADVIFIAKLNFAEARKPYDNFMAAATQNSLRSLLAPEKISLLGATNPQSAFYSPGSSYGLISRARDAENKHLGQALDLYLQPYTKTPHSVTGEPAMLLKNNPEAARSFQIDQMLQLTRTQLTEKATASEGRPIQLAPETAEAFQRFQNQLQQLGMKLQKTTEENQKLEAALKTQSELIEQNNKLITEANERLARQNRMADLQSQHMMYRQLISAAVAVAPESKEIQILAAGASTAMQIEMLLASGLSAGAATAGIGAAVVLFAVAISAILNPGKSGTQLILEEIADLKNMIRDLRSVMEQKFRDAERLAIDNLNRTMQRLDLMERHLRGDLQEIHQAILATNADLQAAQDRIVVIGEVFQGALQANRSSELNRKIGACLDDSPLAQKVLNEEKYFDCLTTFLTCGTHDASDAVSLHEWLGPKAIAETDLISLQTEANRQFSNAQDWNKFRTHLTAMERVRELHQRNQGGEVLTTRQRELQRVPNPVLVAACADAYLTVSKRRPDLYASYDPGYTKMLKLIRAVEPAQKALDTYRDDTLLRDLMNDYSEAVRDFSAELVSQLRHHRDLPLVDLWSLDGGAYQPNLVKRFGPPVLTKIAAAPWDKSFGTAKGHQMKPEQLPPYLEVSGERKSAEAAKEFSDAIWARVPDIFKVKQMLGHGQIEISFSDMGIQGTSDRWDRNFQYARGGPFVTLRAVFKPAGAGVEQWIEEFRLTTVEDLEWAMVCWTVNGAGNSARARWPQYQQQQRELQSYVGPDKAARQAELSKQEASIKADYERAMNPQTRAPYFDVAYARGLVDILAEIKRRWDDESYKHVIMRGEAAPQNVALTRAVTRAARQEFRQLVAEKRTERIRAVMTEITTAGTPLHGKLERLSGIRKLINQQIMYTLPGSFRANAELRGALSSLPETNGILRAMKSSGLHGAQKSELPMEFAIVDAESAQFAEIGIREALQKRLDKLDSVLQGEYAQNREQEHPVIKAVTENLLQRYPGFIPSLPPKEGETLAVSAVAPLRSEPPAKLWQIDDTQGLVKAREAYREGLSKERARAEEISELKRELAKAEEDVKCIEASQEKMTEAEKKANEAPLIEAVKVRDDLKNKIDEKLP